MMRKLLLALALGCATPALAGYSGTVPGGSSVTMGGDVTGPSSATTLAAVNGSPLAVRNCGTGQFFNSLSAGLVPSCGSPGSLTAPAHPGYAKGAFYYSPIGAPAKGATGGTGAATTAVCVPGWIGGQASVNIANLLQRITTTGGTGATITTALYANDFSTSTIARPGALVASTGQVAATATAPYTLTEALNASSVTPGFYWWCLQASDTAIRYVSLTGFGTDDTYLQYAGSGDAAAYSGQSNSSSGISTSVTSYGTWPATFVGGSNTWTSAGSAAAPMIRFNVQ